MKKPYSQLVSLLFFSSITSISFGQWNWDPAQNTPICVAAGEQKDARIESDGNGGAFIAWKDYRAGLPDIYVQHIDSNGVVQWTIDGVGAVTDAADQSTPSIVSDMAGGIIVTWSDWRSGIERDIYAQRIDPSGNILWTVNGAPVTTQNEREHNERIISDGAGGCIIAFEKQVSNWEIWVQRLNSSGTQMWPAGGVPVTTFFSNRRNPKLQMDHSGGAYITWQDNRNIDYDVYAQHLSSTGTRLWGDSALQVTNVIDDQNNPKIDPDNISGGVYICWADQRNGLNNDVYCQRIDSLGNFLWPMNGKSACNATDDQSAIDILSNSGINGVIVTWKDNRAGNNDIYAQHLDVNGNALWALNGIVVCNNSMPQVNPNICGDSKGGAVITYQDSVASSQWNVSAQRVDTLGNLLWGSGVTVGGALGSQTSPKNVSDRNGGSIFVFEDNRSGIKDLYAHRIGANGQSIGIPQENISYLNVFPNPFKGAFQLKYTLKNPDEMKLDLYTITGEKINGFQFYSVIEGLNGTIYIDASTLDPGVYVLYISGEKSFKSLHMIKD